MRIPRRNRTASFSKTTAMVASGTLLVLGINTVFAASTSLSPNSSLKPSPQQLGNTLNAYTSGLPFAMPHMTVPNFPARVFNITTYGAKSGIDTSDFARSKTNTKAIQAAIDAASKAGGGEVEIPQGTWMTGPISLKSNVNLHVDTGAIVQFTSDLSQYQLVPDGSKFTVESPISANNVNNIAITGSGIFNGNGNVWRPVKHYKLSEKQWDDLIQTGGVAAEGSTILNPSASDYLSKAESSSADVWWPSVNAANGEATEKALEKKKDTTPADWVSVKRYLRPIMVYFVGDKNILLDGPTFKNAPTHTVKINSSSNVVIRNTNISNPWYSQNTDGFDISADTDVLMYKDHINTGDDGIALESSPHTGVDYAVKNIVIEDVSVYNAHSGFAVGSDTDGNVENVYVNNCTYDGTVDGLRFKSGIGKGGVVKNIWMNNIHMRNIQDYAITYNDSYVNNQVGESNTPPDFSQTKYAPIFENMIISNVDCDYAQNAIRMNGLPGLPISNIQLSNINIQAKNGDSEEYVQGIAKHNVNIQTGVTELGEVLHQ